MRLSSCSSAGLGGGGEERTDVGGVTSDKWVPQSTQPTHSPFPPLLTDVHQWEWMNDERWITLDGRTWRESPPSLSPFLPALFIHSLVHPLIHCFVHSCCCYCCVFGHVLGGLTTSCQIIAYMRGGPRRVGLGMLTWVPSMMSGRKRRKWKEQRREEKCREKKGREGGGGVVCCCSQPWRRRRRGRRRAWAIRAGLNLCNMVCIHDLMILWWFIKY